MMTLLRRAWPCAQEVSDDLTGDDLSLANQDDVPIEISQAGLLGIPQEAGPAYLVDTDASYQDTPPRGSFPHKIEALIFSCHSSCLKKVNYLQVSNKYIINIR